MAGQLINRGEGTWLIRVYLGRVEGKRKYFNETFHGTKKDAEKRKRELLTKADAGLLLAGRGEVDTVSGFAEVWLGDIARRLRERTVITYRGVVDRRINPRIGDLPMHDVDHAAIRGWIAALGEEGLAPRTIRLSFEVLRNILESAVEEGLLSFNPARTRAVAKLLPAHEKKERVTIPAAKLPAFLDAADNEPYGPVFYLLLMGGLRPSEALALRVKDVRLPRVRVSRVLVDKSESFPSFTPPKSKRSRRTVTVDPRTADAIRLHIESMLEDADLRDEGLDEDDLLFTDADGRPMRQYSLRAPFARILEKAGLPPMRLYDLRHSCATLLLEAGEDLEVVKQRLGHSSIALTSDTYAGAAQGIQDRAADAFGKIAGNGHSHEDEE